MTENNQNKPKKDWRTEAKEILSLVAYAAACGLVIFQMNYGCNRQGQDDAAADAKQKLKKIEAATDSIRTNQIIKTR